MTRTLLMLLGCCVFQLALPAAVAAQSFDCAKAATGTEKMICADPEIAKLDSQMAERYKVLLTKDAEDRAGVFAVQSRWLLETRNAAKLPAALKQVYVDRVADLDVSIACTTLDGSVADWPEIIRCSLEDFYKRDAELGAVFRKLLAQPDIQLDSEATALLKDSQAAWLKYREVQCEWETYESRGGTLRTMEIYGCARTLTEARIKQLTPQQ